MAKDDSRFENKRRVMALRKKMLKGGNGIIDINKIPHDWVGKLLREELKQEKLGGRKR